MTTIQAGGNAQSTLIAGGQPVLRANTIHRTLMVPNNQQLSKPKSKKRSAARKNPPGNVAASVSLKREIDMRSN